MHNDIHQATWIDDSTAETEESGKLREVGYAHFERYRQELRRFVARRLSGRQVTEDVVQEIYLKLLRYPQKDAIRNPRGLIFTIAARAVADALTGQKYSRQKTIDPQAIETQLGQDHEWSTPSAESQVEAEDEILSILSELPASAQIAFVRSRRDNWSLERIGRELGCGPDMAKKHIARALAHFMKRSKK